ncbi:hypothetical protein NQ317_015525 [Molorchus minor]|uniref:Uncharacterized protein n=1 Tax=Molorchus minor TaxID=1323400 RepID=A0ABQ9JNH3_9CUCU|nr:hypothetical protein NQ317_015525 [Molorchus minor]
MHPVRGNQLLIGAGFGEKSPDRKSSSRSARDPKRKIDVKNRKHRIRKEPDEEGRNGDFDFSIDSSDGKRSGAAEGEKEQKKS